MKVTDYFSQILISYGVTDIFGIPGGVVLKFVKAIVAEGKIRLRLNYHEQMSGFAACGYAQASGKLGVAYATRGPGICNMFTCIAEAYQESLPVLFITAHGRKENLSGRFGSNQEMDIVSCVKGITKYAAEINSAEDILFFITACREAVEDRKGPVLVDIAEFLFDMEVSDAGIDENLWQRSVTIENQLSDDMHKVTNLIAGAKRPIILIGDGLRHCNKKILRYYLEKVNIPVLSSRGAQDIFSDSTLYYGYIGSHGIRYSNFILSKADLIIAIGNRLAFPSTSASYAPLLSRFKLVRVDIDGSELSCNIPNSTNILMDGENFLKILSEMCSDKCFDFSAWQAVCTELMKQLHDIDMPEPVQKLKKVFATTREAYENNIGIIVVADVGNNEFWASRAFEAVRPMNGRFMCSKAFGTLGNGLGKAIGAYYAMHCPVFCVIGDQGFQLNVQELQFISSHRLPISIIVMNDKCSGMIAQQEKNLFGDTLFLVDESNGYTVPDIKKISEAYGLEYYCGEIPENTADNPKQKPLLCEISYAPDVPLVPALPVGNPCQDMFPLLNRELYNYFNDM